MGYMEASNEEMQQTLKEKRNNPTNQKICRWCTHKSKDSQSLVNTIKQITRSDPKQYSPQILVLSIGFLKDDPRSYKERHQVIIRLGAERAHHLRRWEISTSKLREIYKEPMLHRQKGSTDPMVWLLYYITFKGMIDLRQENRDQGKRIIYN